MLRDFLEILNDLRKKILSSRIIMLIIIHSILVFILAAKLFNLQLVKGRDFQEQYVQKTEKKVLLPASRGNIYDRNGNLLAYNELAYGVTIMETGYYNTNGLNLMVLRLVRLLEKHGEHINVTVPIEIDTDGNYEFTFSTDIAKKRFLRDFYGLKSIDELDKNDKTKSDITAYELIERANARYRLNDMKDEHENAVEISQQENLNIINIRYAMAGSRYHRYTPTNIVKNISEDTKTDILENTGNLIGVEIETEINRVYNDSIYFSSVVGYIGKVQGDRLEELKKDNPEFEDDDNVGIIGVEQSMESELRGTKGSKTMIVDYLGHIMVVSYETPAISGNNVYLTIDRELQIGTYHLVEQQLAGILASKLDIADDPNTDKTDSTERKIPIKNAYFQLINNDVLSMDAFSRADASDIEKGIFDKFTQYRQKSMDEIRAELISPDARIMNMLESDKKAFMYYLYETIANSSQKLIVDEKIDTNADYYLKWKADEISLRDFLYAGISNSWIDTSKLNINSKYSNADDIYIALIDYALGLMKDDKEFSKLIYKYMIKQGSVTGRELCLSLYYQGILNYDEAAINALSSSGENYAFNFMIDKIKRIEITPAQLALEPCTGGAVVVDTNTGEIKALVSYPGYDSNKLVNSIDNTYFAKLLTDQSQPLYNNATQAKKAPGSTFKPIVAVAGIEENVISPYDTVDCTGNYDIITPPIKCWIYPGHHGKLNVVGAIQNSCNFYFVDIGHRLSLQNNGEYSAELGLSRIRKYASLFGLDHKSGVELVETEPEISNENPEPSAIGQGTHSFANVQLARYVAAVASRGNVFELSVVNKITDGGGIILKDYSPNISSHIDIKDSTWEYVHEGMKGVVENGSAKNVFKDLKVSVAGKTGTAQESKTKANHAFFISFAPYSKPEIAVTVNIPFGYSSSNAAAVAKNIYKLYFGFSTLEEIENSEAARVFDIRRED